MTQAFKIGSVILDSDVDVKNIFVECAAAKYNCLEFPLGTNYQVPAGYEFVITKIRVSSTVAAGRVYLGYGDTAVDSSDSAPTNWKQISSYFRTVAAETMYTQDVHYVIPGSKYPTIYTSGQTMYVDIEGFIREE